MKDLVATLDNAKLSVQTPLTLSSPHTTAAQHVQACGAHMPGTSSPDPPKVLGTRTRSQEAAV